MPAQVQLHRITNRLLSLLEEDEPAFEARYGKMGEERENVRQSVQKGAAMPGLIDDEPWGPYMATDPEERAIVGMCAFKNRPGPAATVEIGYFTLPTYQRRGYALAMAEGLRTIAKTSAEIDCLEAHTRLENQISGRILAKLGFTKTGQIADPKDGVVVWHWRLRLRNRPSSQEARGPLA